MEMLMAKFACEKHDIKRRKIISFLLWLLYLMCKVAHLPWKCFN